MRTMRMVQFTDKAHQLRAYNSFLQPTKIQQFALMTSLISSLIAGWHQSDAFRRRVYPQPHSYDLPDPRDHFVGHQLAVLLPIRPVFCAASDVVTEGAVSEEQGEEEHVEVGQCVVEQAGGCPQESCCDLRDVMEVAREAPPACMYSCHRQ